MASPQGGYTARLLAQAQSKKVILGRGLLGDAAMLGGLSAAATLACRAFAGHPAAQVVALGFLAAEGLFYAAGKLR